MAVMGPLLRCGNRMPWLRDVNVGEHMRLEQLMQAVTQVRHSTATGTEAWLVHSSMKHVSS